jgi:hypothetical protein
VAANFVPDFIGSNDYLAYFEHLPSSKKKESLEIECKVSSTVFAMNNDSLRINTEYNLLFSIKNIIFTFEFPHYRIL